MREDSREEEEEEDGEEDDHAQQHPAAPSLPGAVAVATVAIVAIVAPVGISMPVSTHVGGKGCEVGAAVELRMTSGESHCHCAGKAGCRIPVMGENVPVVVRVEPPV